MEPLLRSAVQYFYQRQQTIRARRMIELKRRIRAMGVNPPVGPVERLADCWMRLRQQRPTTAIMVVRFTRTLWGTTGRYEVVCRTCRKTFIVNREGSHVIPVVSELILHNTHRIYVANMDTHYIIGHALVSETGPWHRLEVVIPDYGQFERIVL